MVLSKDVIVRLKAQMPSHVPYTRHHASIAYFAQRGRLFRWIVTGHFANA